MKLTHKKKALTIRETAEILRVSERTIFNYLRQGLLKSIKVGGTKKVGKHLIPIERVEKLLGG